MSWNIKTPGDYINGPLTVAGAVTLNSGLTVAGGARFNSTVAVGMTPEKSLNVKTTYGFALASNGGFKVENYTDTRGLYFEHILGGTILENAYYYGANQFYPTATSSSSISLDAGSITFFTNSGLTIGTPFLRTQRAIIDGAGQLGLGIVPNTWSQGKVIELGSVGNSIWGAAPNQTIITANSYFNGGWKYAANGTATNYEQASGQHFWYSAPTNTLGAGQTCTFGAAKMALDASGNLAPLGNLVVASGKGIDFSAGSNAAGMTSELLNDYEEGTWTGTLKGTTADPTTAVTATGRYTKVGRVVSLQIHFDNVNTTGASGVIYVLGAPFTNGGLSTFGTAASGVGATFTGTLTSYIGNAQTNLFFVGVNSNASTSDATHNAGSGRYFWLNTTYIV